MRPYGPGHAQPHAGRGRGRAASPDSQSDDPHDRRLDASASSSGSEQQDDLGSSQAEVSVSQQEEGDRQQQQYPQDPAAFRPWTLPHVDARYGRHSQRRRQQQQQQEEGEEEEGGRGVPTVVVHPMLSGAGDPWEQQQTTQQQQQQQQDVWSIRPRAGSGRMSLGRRRRYDSYVGTLDTHTLEMLDEEILQSAVVLGMGPEDLGDDDADVYGGRTPLPSQPRRRRPLGRQEEGEEEGDEEGKEEVRVSMSPARTPHASMSSQRRQTPRERLCEEEGSHRLSSPSRQASASPSRRSPARQQQRRGDEHDEEAADEHGMRPASARSAGRRGGNSSSSSSSKPSPSRKLRAESVTRRAPPDPTFHDPKMGPPPPMPMGGDGGQIPLSDNSTGKQQGRRLESSTWAVGGKGHKKGGRRAGMEEEEDGEEEGGMAWDAQGSAASSSKGRHRGRDSSGFKWLYGDSGGGHDDGGMGGSGTHPGGKRTLLHWLDQRLPRMREEERVARAAVYLSDAIDTRPVRMRGGGKFALMAYRLRTRGLWVRLLQALAVTHLLLALWEPPRAGLPDDALYFDSIGRQPRTGAPAAAMRLLGLEMVLVLLFALDLGLEVFALGVTGFFGMHAPVRVVEGKGRGPALRAKLWGQLRFALVVLFFADVCLSLDQHTYGAPRFSKPLRPLYLICLSDTLKRWTILLLHLLTQLRDVALGTGILLGLFSLLGLLLFSETGYYASSLPYLNFDDFLNSAVALYVLTTTQNFGALLNPAHAHSPLYFFFFMAFTLTVVLFLAHLALPRVFWVYHAFQRHQAYEARLLERLALVACFRCLDGAERKGWADLSSFRSLLRYARPDVFDLRTGYEKDAYCGATEHMFAQLARTHPGRIYAHEFLQAGVCEVVLTDYYPAVPTLPPPGPTASERHQRERARFRAILGSAWCDAVSMALLLLCCFFLAFYGSPAVSKGSLRGFAYFVIVAFTVEIALKLWAFGIKPFFASAANALDALVVGAAFSSLVAYSFSPPHSPMRQSQQMANLCVLFLSLRLVRLFPRCQIFAKFSSAFRVLPFFLSSFALCVLLAYSWSVLGMAVFAKHADAVATVAASGPVELQAWAAVDNFNCFWSASVTLFQVATTYDWYKIMYLWMAVTHTGWTALYFVSFHLVANVLVFQLTAALFVDAFLSFHDKRWVEGEEAETAPSQALLPPSQPVAFGRVGDVGDGTRWSYKSEASAPPASLASPTPSEEAEAADVEAGGRQQGGQMRRSGVVSTPARRRSGGLSPGALPHSALYTASVI